MINYKEYKIYIKLEDISNYRVLAYRGSQCITKEGFKNKQGAIKYAKTQINLCLRSK